MSGVEIKVADLTYAVGGHEILKNVNMEIDRGAFVVVTGPNGSGKTTFLRCVVGVLKCEGIVEVMGRDPRRDVEVRRGVGYVPQLLPFPPLAVREVVWLHYKIYGISNGEVLKEWGLAALLDRKVARLSGGERQRLAWALALSHKPRVLILDEPFNNLDAEGKRLALEKLRELREKVTVVMAIHEAYEVEKLADAVVRFEGGMARI
ncbi:MAG: ABC transporter ATP-binding protein [Pyrobaculum sp.]